MIQILKSENVVTLKSKNDISLLENIYNILIKKGFRSSRYSIADVKEFNIEAKQSAQIEGRKLWWCSIDIDFKFKRFQFINFEEESDIDIESNPQQYQSILNELNSL